MDTIWGGGWDSTETVAAKVNGNNMKLLYRLLFWFLSFRHVGHLFETYLKGFTVVVLPSSEVSLGGNGMCAAADGCWGAVGLSLMTTSPEYAWFLSYYFHDPVLVSSICTDGFEHFQVMWLSCLQLLLFSCFLVAPIISLTLSFSPPFHILFDVLAYLVNILFHPRTRDTFLCSILSLGRTKSCLFYVMCDWGVDEMFVHCS